MTFFPNLLLIDIPVVVVLALAWASTGNDKTC